MTHRRLSPRFGASGWRGPWGEDFSWPRFRMLLRGRKPLSERLARLERRHSHRCRRMALAFALRSLEVFEKFRAAPPRWIDGARVLELRGAKGLYLALADGFVMLRPSGSEPLVRVHAEPPGQRVLKRRLQAGAVALGAFGGSRVSG